MYNEGIDFVVEPLLDAIEKSGKRVLIWGACERNKPVLELLNRHDIAVAGYIDKKAEDVQITGEQNGAFTYNDLPVYGKEIIETERFFVYVGLRATYEDVIACLAENGYKEFIDYWYANRTVILDGSNSYKDLYGNEYCGENYKLRLTLQNGGKLFLGRRCKFDTIYITAANQAQIRIGDDVRLRGTIVLVGDYFSEIKICDHVTSCTNLYISSVQESKIEIGEDSMFSRDVVIRAGNCHNVFDLENNRNLSSGGRSVIIGKHVWIGHRAVLFNGCEIGNGSIVGINAFVNKKFPENCSLAGNPAKVIKRNVAWRRESFPYFDSYEDFSEFDFR